MSNDLEAAQQSFLLEAQELLTAMEDALLHLENSPDDMEAINAQYKKQQNKTNKLIVQAGRRCFIYCT